MENHGGALFYYVPVLLIGFAPWSAFLGPSLWYAIRAKAQTDSEQVPSDPRLAFRFLWCWIGVYLVFFSVAGTKLPNYILPLYPPTALLTGHFLDRWRYGAIRPPAWVLQASLACLGLIGVAVGVGLCMAGGVIPGLVLQGRSIRGMEQGAWLGLLPVFAAGLGWCCLRRQQLGRCMLTITAMAVLLVGSLAAWGGSALNPHKASRAVAEMIRADQPAGDIRIGCYQYWQPSLVFYCQREVARMDQEQDALEFLDCPLPVYLVVPASLWDALRPKIAGAWHLVGRRRDMYRNCDVIVVRNAR
jgi:4-amino-4-deoxy-L-arabinose transferase-like glycosyltransferase